MKDEAIKFESFIEFRAERVPVGVKPYERWQQTDGDVEQLAEALRRSYPPA
jgi:hypothetical protein